MIWILQETVNEIIANGPEIETPSGEIRVVDVDTAARWIKKLAFAAEHPEYPEGDSLTVIEARKFLDELYMKKKGE